MSRILCLAVLAVGIGVPSGAWAGLNHPGDNVGTLNETDGNDVTSDGEPADGRGEVDYDPLGEAAVNRGLVTGTAVGDARLLVIALPTLGVIRAINYAQVPLWDSDPVDAARHRGAWRSMARAPDVDEDDDDDTSEASRWAGDWVVNAWASVARNGSFGSQSEKDQAIVLAFAELAVTAIRVEITETELTLHFGQSAEVLPYSLDSDDGANVELDIGDAGGRSVLLNFVEGTGAEGEPLSLMLLTLGHQWLPLERAPEE